MVDGMEGWRAQLFKNSQVHGGIADSGLGKTMTPESLKASQKGIEDDEKLKVILAEAEQRGLVKRDDPLLKELVVLFFGDAKTPDGRERAVRMACGIVSRIRQRFDVTEKK